MKWPFFLQLKTLICWEEQVIIFQTTATISCFIIHTFFKALVFKGLQTRDLRNSQSSESYSEPCQIFKMNLLSPKHPVLGVWHGSKYAPGSVPSLVDRGHQTRRSQMYNFSSYCYNFLTLSLMLCLVSLSMSNVAVSKQFYKLGKYQSSTCIEAKSLLQWLFGDLGISWFSIWWENWI